MSVTSTLHRNHHHTAADRDTVLITDAPVSFTEQHDARVRKYVLLMSLRIPALVLAAVLYAATGLWWLPLIVVAASLPLPWVAVLIANDGPPRAREDVDRYIWGTEVQAPAIAAPARRELDAAKHQD
ncbi:DUF3099 domain-containing protein [Rhodococcus antarcticus]|uniref:DUF3099 domain-containing protein n=1 Tax=Rhodococcus antarcticus TaxID=2987751 RepID=A0ABY6P439_9NOCA|nr:DUF3099 domain-containing protein [Rhodococcus antarcticus]UZJ26412.1 DUF3099 domain-containing protein [Rhodococcus antarcticus]